MLELDAATPPAEAPSCDISDAGTISMDLNCGIKEVKELFEDTNQTFDPK